MARLVYLLLLCSLAPFGSFAQINIADMLVEYQKTPLGIDEEKPRFSWKMTAPAEERGCFQSAYQIEVRNEEGETVWNSDVTRSDKSLNIAYGGKPLKPATRYSWTVAVWDQNERVSRETSWFETGLMNSNPELETWDGASWIGTSSEDLVLYSHALSVFKAGYKLRLDEQSQSTKAGFILGANDRRLMDGNLNILGVEKGINESYYAFELDISELKKMGDGFAKFNIYRVGYLPSDKADAPIHSITIPHSLINTSNRYDQHKMILEMVFGKCNIYLNGEGEEHKINMEKNPGQGFGESQGLVLNPHGDGGGDQIVYPLLADIGFKVEKGQAASFSDVTIWNYRAPSNAIFREELQDQDGYQGIFKDALAGGNLSIEGESYHVNAGDEDVLITADPSRNSTPMLRLAFKVQNKNIKKARLYVTARGIYEMYLNGERIGDDYFNPGSTQYNKTHMYQTYDVTDMVTSGGNVIGAWLSEGWWSGNIGGPLRRLDGIALVGWQFAA